MTYKTESFVGVYFKVPTKLIEFDIRKITCPNCVQQDIDISGPFCPACGTRKQLITEIKKRTLRGEDILNRAGIENDIFYSMSTLTELYLTSNTVPLTGKRLSFVQAYEYNEKVKADHITVFKSRHTEDIKKLEKYTGKKIILKYGTVNYEL